MSVHVDNKRLIAKYMTDSDDIKAVIARCTLKSVDKQILTMILADRHDEGFVADTLGYSYSQIKRRFAAALPVFISVAQRHHLI